MCIFTDKTRESLKELKCKEIRIQDKMIRLEGGEWFGYSIPSESGKGWMRMEGLGFNFEDALDWLLNL